MGIGSVHSLGRREFLGASLAAPAVALRALQSSSFDPWIEVHAGHLRANAAAAMAVA